VARALPPVRLRRAAAGGRPRLRPAAAARRGCAGAGRGRARRRAGGQVVPGARRAAGRGRRRLRGGSRRAGGPPVAAGRPAHGPARLAVPPPAAAGGAPARQPVPQSRGVRRHVARHRCGARGWVAAPSMDLGLALVGVWVFLDTTLRETLAPHAIRVFVEAETLAWARADPSCDRRHLVVVLLQSHGLRRLLSEAGADLPRMHAELVAGQRDSQGAEDDPDVVVHLSDYCPLGHDMEATLHGAACQMRLKGEDQLRLDHLVMSLWGSGRAAVELQSRQAADVAGPRVDPPIAQYRLNVRHLEEQLHALKARAEQARLLKGPRGPVVLGCLPLEPAVAVYTASRAVLATVATAWMLLTQTSAGAMVGLSTVPEMRWLELAVHAVSAVCAAAGIAGILEHRGGRHSILDAAYDASGNGDIVLEEALDAVSDQKEATEWLASLKRGSNNK
ncbi:unnamed protein product, partial [Prorocentrum cordatum]